MFDKRDYITSMFKKIQHKKYESYCIQRIWHRLNRFDVEFVTQQLFYRPNGSKALADLYLPQFNWVIEIDENYHINSSHQDKIRENDICVNDNLNREKLGDLWDAVDSPVEIIRICASEHTSFIELNKQCDDIVDRIIEEIDAMGDSFIPWVSPYSEEDFYKTHDTLRVVDNVRYRTMRDVGFSIFQRSLPQGGGGFVLDKEKHLFLWFPRLTFEGEKIVTPYANVYSADGKYIYESSINENNTFMERALNHYANDTRIVFPRYKNSVGKLMYKFKGVFKMNIDLTKRLNKVVWEKVSDEINIKEIINE